MRLGVLGPVQCAVVDTPVNVAGGLNRALLAALAIDNARMTGIDELVDAMWGDQPPAAAEKVVRNRVSLLRGQLTAAFIETVGAGYRLGQTVSVDAREFENAGRAVVDRLGLWRGLPFGEIAEWPPARAAGVRLSELRAHLEEVSIAEQLDWGVDASLLVGPVEQLVESEPFRERRWALLMRTLYLAGRQHDALLAFQRARDMLREELGLSPGAELLAVERSILNQEPTLAPQPSAAQMTRPSSLIGRTDDAAALRTLLRESRLVTLVGLGGVGKTSLARDLTAEWGAARCIVDLGAVDDPAAVDEAVARSLRIAAGGDARQAVSTWASAAAPCLLMLDNCEHVRDAAREITSVVLAGGDGVTVLATSRIPLGHRDETVFHLQPLARVDAVAMYRARADRRRPTTDDDTVVDRLCQVLSDVPLAIELAAARSSILSPADMIRDLAVVTGTLPKTQGSARWAAAGAHDVVDVVAWAVAALSPDAVMVFRRCAVFPGGFSMDAARAMAEDELGQSRLTDAFADLAEASLIEVRFAAGTRYHYLDLLRQLADQLLDEAGERGVAQERMVGWAVAETDGITFEDLPRLLAEVPNLAVAAQYACARADVDAVLRITGATFVLVTAQRGELVDSKQVGVEMASAEQHPRYARSCAELAFALFFLRGDFGQARHFAEIALQADPGGRSAGWATFVLGHLEGNLERQRQALDIARRCHDPLLQFYASSVIIDNGGKSGAPDAWELVVDNDRVAAQIDEPWATIMTTIVRGMACCQADPEAALIHLERAAEMAERGGMTSYSTVARALAGLAGGTDPRARLEMTRRGLIEADEAGVSYFTVLALARLARTLTEAGRPERAAMFAGAARARFRSAETGTRTLGIDREDYGDQLTMFDIGLTMDVGELLALIDEWLAELTHAAS